MTQPNLHSRTKVFIAMAIIVMLLVPYSSYADGAYDGIYDRPSYFPEFKVPTDWPSTMTYFVCARLNGARLHNYEVAVYDRENNLRAIGRSVAFQQELCTLTIPGEVGDEFHFKVVYGDFTDPTIVDVPESCSFSANEIMGNLDYPYWLTISELTGIDTFISRSRESEERIFTLSGVQVKEAVRPGIYIKNGKKFIVY